jgi:predicted nucleic-acid-binding Zn-ribbon protein
MRKVVHKCHKCGSEDVYDFIAVNLNTGRVGLYDGSPIKSPIDKVWCNNCGNYVLYNSEVKEVENDK